MYRKGRDSARKDVITVDTHNFSDLLCWMVCCSGYSFRFKPSPVEMEHKLYFYSFVLAQEYLYTLNMSHTETQDNRNIPNHKKTKFVYESIICIKGLRQNLPHAVSNSNIVLALRT